MENEILQFEDMQFVNPEVSQNERLQFIDTLREMQAQNNAQINQQTQALGSDVPVYQGGLAGSEGIFQARYQTPQMDATVANLQNVARQTALNTALANQETMWKNRYDQARRELQDAQHNFSTKPSGTTGGDKVEGGINQQVVPEGSVSGDVDNTAAGGLQGTTSITQDDWTIVTDPTTGATVRQHKDGRIEVLENGQWVPRETTSQVKTESVNDAINRLQGEGKIVTNKRIQADDQGNVTLEWVDGSGNTGVEIINVKLNVGHGL